MQDNHIKTYNSDEKKMLVYKIENLKQKKHYIDIFNIIKHNEPNYKFTKNNNGIFFDLKYISNDVLYKIDKYINSISIHYNVSESDSISLKENISDHKYDCEFNNNGPKLSNYEKNLIKRNRLLSDSIND